jgi:hypothetical protein
MSKSKLTIHLLWRRFAKMASGERARRLAL